METENHSQPDLSALNTVTTESTSDHPVQGSENHLLPAFSTSNTMITESTTNHSVPSENHLLPCFSTLDTMIIESTADQSIQNSENHLLSDLINNRNNRSVQSLSIYLLNLARVFPKTQRIATRNFSDAIHNTIVEAYNKELREKVSQEFPKLEPEEYVEQNHDYVFLNYLLKVYMCKKTIESSLIKEMHQSPDEKSSYIFFFYQETWPGRIFALTSGDARHVINKFVDYSFSIPVAERVADPMKINHVVRRCLFGENPVREDLLHPKPHELFNTANLYYLMESFICDLKNTSSLFRLIASKVADSGTKSTLGRCWIHVSTAGVLRIGQRLKVTDYPSILDLLGKIVDGKPTYDTNRDQEIVDPRFSFVHYLKPNTDFTKEELDQLLIERIVAQRTENKDLEANIRPKKLKEFFFSNTFEMNIKTRQQYRSIGSTPPEITDILETIDDIIKNGDKDGPKKRRKKDVLEEIEINVKEDEEGEKKDDDKDEYKRKLKEALEIGKLRFGDHAPEKFIDCIEGPVYISDSDVGKTYFKMRGMWYRIETDYVNLLLDDFRKLIEKTLILPGTEGHLHRKWVEHKKPKEKKKKITKKRKIEIEEIKDDDEKKEDESTEKRKRVKEEEIYNISYLEEPCTDEKGYFVFDQILPLNVESCDIIKYTKKTVYIYQVKKALGQHTRDATSQIMSAATMIRATLAVNSQSPDFLQRLWTKAVVREDKPDAGKEEPVAGEVEPVAGEEEPIAEQEKPVAEEEEPVADEEEPVAKKEKKKSVAKEQAPWRIKLREKLEKFGEQNFYKIFRERKIVFVYAYVPTPKNSFTHALKKIDNLLSKPIIDELIKANYLDPRNLYPTIKFYSLTSKKDFYLSFRPPNVINEPAYQKCFKILSRYKFSNSMYAKVELLQLAQTLRELGFDFKICEISKAKAKKQCVAGSSLA